MKKIEVHLGQDLSLKMLPNSVSVNSELELPEEKNYMLIVKKPSKLKDYQNN
jgi:hypothetical protein